METTSSPGAPGSLAVDGTAGMALIAPAMSPPPLPGEDSLGPDPGIRAVPAPASGKLGVALAGGGFRASLFHLGVLRRLAELDVLRRVEVLSTVSGGSITGALYVLLLKKYLERSQGGSLERAEYVELVKELETILVGGVRKNLRTRLLLNPIGMLSVLLTGDSIGRRMARLYERYLIAAVGLPKVSPPPWWRPAWLWPGQVRMTDLAIAPPGKSPDEELGAYNARQREAGGSVVTNIVINATTLNSGGRFHFSAVELGDFYLGYFRADEFDDLLARKELLALGDKELVAVADGGSPPGVTVPGSGGPIAYRWPNGAASRAAALAMRRRRAATRPARDPFAELFAHPGFPGLIEEAPFGMLRKAKVAAWYLRHRESPAPPVPPGRAPGDHSIAFWTALSEIDQGLGETLEKAAAGDGGIRDAALDYILELYLLRSAECVSGRIHKDWKNIRVGHAVGASACFPPVFPPFLFLGVYDDLHVSRLGLTDGGVYDNIGITALMDEGCTEVIASDTSGLFDVAPASPCGRVGLALRIPNLLMRALGGSQKVGLQERGRVSQKLAGLLADAETPPTPAQQEIAALRAGLKLDPLVYFHIDSPPVDVGEADGFGQPLELTTRSRDIAGLRTDLDGFGDVEVAALVNHGYDVADRHIRRHGPMLVQAKPDGAPRSPREQPTKEDAERALPVGSARFFRALKLGCWFPWIVTVAAATLLIAFAWRSGLTIDRIVGAAGYLVGKQIELLNWLLRLVPGTEGPASASRTWLAALLVLFAIWRLVALARRPRPPEKARHDRISPKRIAATVVKYAGALRGNFLWGVFGFPIFAALAGTAVSAVSYVCYHLPFMRATRIRRRGPTAPGS